jgi:hypothetical protein
MSSFSRRCSVHLWLYIVLVLSLPSLSTSTATSAADGSTSADEDVEPIITDDVNDSETIETSQGDLSGRRQKRYTDFQERAAATCTGMCMFSERKTYSECFDLCNWNGRSPSPWMKLDQFRAAASKELLANDIISDRTYGGGRLPSGLQPRTGNTRGRTTYGYSPESQSPRSIKFKTSGRKFS